MKRICVNCEYRNRAIDQWPCDSCHDVGGNMTMFVPPGGRNVQIFQVVPESNGCNDDYCEINFEEE